MHCLCTNISCFRERHAYVGQYTTCSLCISEVSPWCQHIGLILSVYRTRDPAVSRYLCDRSSKVCYSHWVVHQEGLYLCYVQWGILWTRRQYVKTQVEAMFTFSTGNVKWAFYD